MDIPIWQIIVGCALFVLYFSVSVWLFFRNWISAAPIEPQPFDPGEIPPFLREREEAFFSQLQSRGYRCIGNCQWGPNNRMQILTSVWIREEIVAEINVIVGRSRKKSGVSLAIGQEYQDKTSIVIGNHPRNLFALIGNSYSFPGIDDVFVLEEILHRLIGLRRQASPVLIPTNASEYKKSDFVYWREQLAKGKYFRLERKRNRYRPTWKLLFLITKNQFKSSKSFQLTRNRKSRTRADLLLNKLGLPDLESMRSDRGAFPVVVKPLADSIADPPAEPPPPQTSPSP